MATVKSLENASLHGARRSGIVHTKHLPHSASAMSWQPRPPGHRAGWPPPGPRAGPLCMAHVTGQLQLTEAGVGPFCTLPDRPKEENHPTWSPLHKEEEKELQEPRGRQGHGALRLWLYRQEGNDLMMSSGGGRREEMSDHFLI